MDWCYFFGEQHTSAQIWQADLLNLNYPVTRNTITETTVPLPLFIHLDDHVDAGPHIGVGHASGVDHILVAHNEPMGYLMVLAHLFPVPTGDDHTVFVHNIHIVLGVAGDPLDQSLG